MDYKHILVVDDDPDILEIISLYLRSEGFQVAVCDDGIKALDLARINQYDLIILDIMLPNMDGRQVCREIKRFSDVPILFASCIKEDIDIVLGYGLGADGYITKPFSPAVLVSQVKAIVRRTGRPENVIDIANQHIIQVGGLTINLLEQLATLEDKRIELSAKEFKLLVLLAQNVNQIFSLEYLYDKVWGHNGTSDLRTVMVHMSNLRKKIEEDPSKPKYIITVRGVGYKLVNNV
ncbi:response regulator transcription factor [Desulfuribacillus alkaliarsenatis]|uniref:DNA-binding response regulator n=1 Tax=Desulfuribacillus alkaliarsenatis TaxID=766136 RepID=A0A1E5G1X4_9FIRM|nr:response regulator transcription factor [Desulfuribacillus alkaliarsenatis]OEF96988.1 DNA-binding response regulator [Desulfuribacillus alkaliarsenatis]